MNKLQSARLKYKPDEIKILFVAEAPPENIERFFYYENVKEKDALFINLIRLLYPEYRDKNGGSVEQIRKHKKALLERFQKDGYYLIDALPEPISLKLNSREREKLIKARKNDLANEIKSLIAPGPYNPEDPHVGIVLIKATVFDALFDYLFVEQRLPVLNNNIKIPFPSHGNTGRFSEELHNALGPFDHGYLGRTKFVSYSGDVTIERA